jgi:hypothetical protein
MDAETDGTVSLSIGESLRGRKRKPKSCYVDEQAAGTTTNADINQRRRDKKAVDEDAAKT